jgi:glyoxylase I family protein
MPDISGVNHIAFSVTDAEKSAQWYGEVLGLQRAMELDSDGCHTVLLIHPATSFMVGLRQWERGSGDAFDEFRTGMDHVSFTVADRAGLEDWERRFTELGVEHSPIADTQFGAMLPFRDLDNVQLEMIVPAG